MNILKIFIALILALVLAVLLFFYFAIPEENYDVQFTVVEISSPNVKSILFIKKRIWGITNDSCLITISTSNKEEINPNKNENYIYKGPSELYYKVKQDSLIIYTRKVSLPPKVFPTKFKVIQIELDNPEMMDFIRNDNYKHKGLTKVY